MYEYKTVTIHFDVIKTLNLLSNDGWDLVCVVEDIYYFRKKVE